MILPVLPALKELAIQLNVPVINSNGNPFNTRQLGNQIIKSMPNCKVLPSRRIKGNEWLQWRAMSRAKAPLILTETCLN